MVSMFNQQAPLSLLQAAQNMVQGPAATTPQAQPGYFRALPYLMAEQGLTQNNGTPLGALAQVLGSYWMKGAMK
ncbi:hypothetical protein [Mitsuokella sp. AF21-1AC]|uniref:hypothetical protein n=1 Tax=Mitsuokella sp. AF21-1AC TaxID=2292235 RepID=UPI000E50B262|nr:hypothetical protein [Mitsuokella sp. AF21-1AC]RGS72004.1 hypothetical protein DWX75_07350 [Mitsuokella sp. AF21-1AC]